MADLADIKSERGLLVLLLLLKICRRAAGRLRKVELKACKRVQPFVQTLLAHRNDLVNLLELQLITLVCQCD